MRPPAVAGSFYPSEPAALAAEVDALMAAATRSGHGSRRYGDANRDQNEGGRAEALIVPHAGYRYSGPVAAMAYARLAPAGEGIGRVVMLGPAHFTPLRGAAVPGVDAFATPLGPVEIDDAARRAALCVTDVSVDDAAHAGEHSLEVQLPFLQRVLGRFRLLPLAVGDADARQVAAAVDAALAAPASDGVTAAVVVASSDLSHYHPRPVATQRDRRTADAILAADEAAIGPTDACGAGAVRALLRWSRGHRLSAELLGLRTSADAGGPEDRVVGYGAFAFHRGDGDGREAR